MDFIIKSNMLFLLWILWPINIFSQLALAPVFDDHMVIQRHKPIKVWGSALPITRITVEFDSQIQQIMSDSLGKWRVQFPASNEGGPYSMSVTSGNEALRIKNILIGELWLCSGQSNMQFALKNSSQVDLELSEIKNPNIRMFRMTGNHNLGPTAFTESEMKSMKEGDFIDIHSWQECDRKSAGDFSAIAYYFGKKLYDSLKVPVGLIQNAIGGSTIESWIDMTAIDSHPKLAYLKSDLWYAHAGIHPWVKSRVLQNLNLFLESGDMEVSHSHPFSPGYLFNCGIKPLSLLPIRGVIWYQGESNATNPESYPFLFDVMKNTWEKSLKQFDLPFLFVQLPRIANRSRWPEFRAQQEKCLEIPNTGMVVSIDEGHLTDVHPKKKKIIGDRLAELALSNIYGFDLNATSSTYESYVWNHKNRKIVIEFNQVGHGLKTNKNEFPKGFSLNGFHTDGGLEIVIVPNEIKIHGSKIILGYPDKFIPTLVNYAWAPYPENNIINDNDLPVAPFRIELIGNN